MKRVLGLLFLLLFFASHASAQCQYYRRKYNTAATIDFCLKTYNSSAANDNEKLQLKVDAAPTTGEIKLAKDEGAEANCSTGSGACVTDEGSCYSMALTSTEMTAARVYVTVIDATSPKVWIDWCGLIETFGNASANDPIPDVNVATNSDKTGYSLTQTFPSNFSSLSIDGSGRVDVGKILGTASAGQAGYVGLDWGQMVNKTTTNALTNTSINTATTCTTASTCAALGTTAKADVNAEVDTALADYDAPTYTEMTAAFTQIKGAGWNSGTDTLELIRDNLASSCTLADGAISAAKIATDGGNKLADMILRRQSVNAESSSYGDTLNFQSLLGAVAKQTNTMSVSGSNLNIYRADGVTLFKAQTLSSDAGAAPITGLSN